MVRRGPSIFGWSKSNFRCCATARFSSKISSCRSIPICAAAWMPKPRICRLGRSAVRSMAPASGALRRRETKPFCRATSSKACRAGNRTSFRMAPPLCLMCPPTTPSPGGRLAAISPRTIIWGCLVSPARPAISRCAAPRRCARAKRWSFPAARERSGLSPARSPSCKACASSPRRAARQSATGCWRKSASMRHLIIGPRILA